MEVKMSKEMKEKLTDIYLDKIKEEGIDEIAMFGINSEDRSSCISVMKAKNAKEGIAMIGMLVKALADEIEVSSGDLAREIGARLDETEAEIEKVKERIANKKVIHIKVTEEDA